ncbi:hypothetical protein BC943DRAFT_331670 [Umbelopsis sp. AD052]|nr:hypothetical protein BC943DRAFT_331670 [Umbelopsis sp. AD052]
MNAARQSYFCHHCEAPVVIKRRVLNPSCPQCKQEFIEELTDVPRRRPSRHLGSAHNTWQIRSSSSSSLVAMNTDDFFSPLLQATLVNNDSRRHIQTPHIAPHFTSSATHTLPVIMINSTGLFHSSVVAGRVPTDPALEYSHYEMRQGTHNVQPQINSLVRDNMPRSRNTSQHANISIQRPPPVYSPSPFASVRIENGRIVQVSMTNTELAIMASCVVCKEDYRVGERALKLPCFHVYHHDCIKPWLKSKKTCPICRRFVEYTSPSSSTRSTNAW